jgi:hypothetical protein
MRPQNEHGLEHGHEHGHEEANDLEQHDEELQRILSRARSLPRESAPERDLWPGVASQITQAGSRLSPAGRAPAKRAGADEAVLSRLAAGLREFAGVPAWAAVASGGVLLIVSTAFATLWWTGQIGASASPRTMADVTSETGETSDQAAGRIADALRVRDGMGEVHQSLLDILEARGEELPPQTLAALEDNLRVIDRAIAEIHIAMQGREHSHTLNLLLAETYRREAELLEQLRWWSPVREEKS